MPEAGSAWASSHGAKDTRVPPRDVRMGCPVITGVGVDTVLGVGFPTP